MQWRAWFDQDGDWIYFGSAQSRNGAYTYVQQTVLSLQRKNKETDTFNRWSHAYTHPMQPIPSLSRSTCNLALFDQQWRNQGFGTIKKIVKGFRTFTHYLQSCYPYPQLPNLSTVFCGKSSTEPNQDRETRTRPPSVATPLETQ